ncbi:hypothetical protein JCM10213_007556 [Rhodosporidiobolus nylandii]
MDRPPFTRAESLASLAPSLASSVSTASSNSSTSSSLFRSRLDKLTSSFSSSKGKTSSSPSASHTSLPSLKQPVKVKEAVPSVYVGGGRGGRGMRVKASAIPEPIQTTAVVSAASSKPKGAALMAVGGGRGGRAAMKMSPNTAATAAAAQARIGSGAGVDAVEDKVVCFPGWATLSRSTTSPSSPSFSLEVFAHGYCYRQQPLSLASGTSRIFYAIARSFAALPKLPGKQGGAAAEAANEALRAAAMGSGGSCDSLGPSLRKELEALKKQGEGSVLEELLRDGEVTAPAVATSSTVARGAIYAEPEEMSADEARLTFLSPSLDTSANPVPSSHPQSLYTASSHPPTRASSPTRSTASRRPASLASSTLSSSSASSAPPAEEWPAPFPPTPFPHHKLPLFHRNVHSRLLPFLGVKLPKRRVRLTVSALPPEGASSSTANGPLAQAYVTTSAPGGGFSTRISIEDEKLDALLSAVDGDFSALQLLVTAELLELEYLYASVAAVSTHEGFIGGGRGGRAATATATVAPVQVRRAPQGWEEKAETTARDSAMLRVGVQPWTEVVNSTKTMFRNCFVREYHDIRVPGMASLYRHLSSAHSVHFHYVSNSPWELFPVIRSFLSVAGFPSGSVTLKEYGGAASAVAKLWEEPGERKRKSVEGVMRVFPGSRFLLVGDSGEQDLQLYASLAVQYPEPVLGIFIRDVTTPFIPPGQPSSSDLSRFSSRGSVGSSELPITLEEMDEETGGRWETLSSRLAEATLASSPSASTSPLSHSHLLALPATSLSSTASALSLPPLTRASTSSSLSSLPSNSSPSASEPKLAAVVSPAAAVVAWEKKLAEARALIPPGVVLRVFRGGDEIREECERLVSAAGGRA